MHWKENGKPLEGPLHDEMLSSRALFKQALQKCKLNEKSIRREKFLNNLNNKDYKEFWKGVNEINKNYTPFPENIDGLDTPGKICEMFSDKYKTILNNNKNKDSSNSNFRWLNLREKTNNCLFLDSVRLM